MVCKMSHEEEAVRETQMKPSDFLELSNNASEARYCDKVKIISGVEPYSPWKARWRCYTQVCIFWLIIRLAKPLFFFFTVTSSHSYTSDRHYCTQIIYHTRIIYYKRHSNHRLNTARSSTHVSLPCSLLTPSCFLPLSHLELYWAVRSGGSPPRLR